MLSIYDMSHIIWPISYDMVHFSLCPEIGIIIFQIGLGRNNFILNYESSINAATKPRYSVCYIGGSQI